MFELLRYVYVRYICCGMFSAERVDVCVMLC